jgi:hypothetical protein
MKETALQVGNFLGYLPKQRERDPETLKFELEQQLGDESFGRTGK